MMMLKGKLSNNSYRLLLLVLLLPLLKTAKSQDAMFIGEIRIFTGNFAPIGWAICNGQSLPIAENQALFSILGFNYGGDGIETFNLPDLRGKIPKGTGPNTTPGSSGGSNSVVLQSANLPPHQHDIKVYNGAGNSASPNNNVIATGRKDDLAPVSQYTTAADQPNATLSPASVTYVGSSQPVSIAPPTLQLNYIIAIVGIFPSQE